MKKQVKIPVIVASSIVGAILIAVIVLCCIVVQTHRNRIKRRSTSDWKTPDSA